MLLKVAFEHDRIVVDYQERNGVMFFKQPF